MSCWQIRRAVEQAGAVAKGQHEGGCARVQRADHALGECLGGVVLGRVGMGSDCGCDVAHFVILRFGLGLAAARQRLDSHGYEGARDLGERAWRLSEASGERVEAGLFLAVLQREMGDVASACRVLESVIAGGADEQARRDARIEQAAALLVQDRCEQALQSLDAAAETAMALGEAGRLARLHYQRGSGDPPGGPHPQPARRVPRAQHPRHRGHRGR